MMRKLLAILIALVLGSEVFAQFAPPASSLPPEFVVQTNPPEAMPGQNPPSFQPEYCEAVCVPEACPTSCSTRLYVQGEYLLWAIKNSPLPVPLVTAGPGAANLTPVLGTPGNSVVMGGQDITNAARNGARVTAGCWFDDDQCFGTAVSYLFLGTQSDSQLVSSNGLPRSAGLSLPFFDVTAPGESSTRIAFPGGFAGTAKLSVTNDMQAWEWNALTRLNTSDRFKLYMLGGFRYWNFNERLAFGTSSPSVVPPPDVFTTLDQFDTRNYFYGGQIGAQAEYRWNRLFVRSQAKLALGAMHEVVVINGQLITNDFNNFGAPQVFPSGYFAQPTNNGKQSATHFAVIPEANCTLGFQMTRRLSLLVGYSFLYVSDVVRPGDQIDRNINPTQAPAITGVPSTTVVGAARPAPLFNTTDFWAQGLNLGLEFRY